MAYHALVSPKCVVNDDTELYVQHKLEPSGHMQANSQLKIVASNVEREGGYVDLVNTTSVSKTFGI